MVLVVLRFKHLNRARRSHDFLQRDRVIFLFGFLLRAFFNGCQVLGCRSFGIESCTILLHHDLLEVRDFLWPESELGNFGFQLISQIRRRTALFELANFLNVRVHVSHVLAIPDRNGHLALVNLFIQQLLFRRKVGIQLSLFHLRILRFLLNGPETIKYFFSEFLTHFLVDMAIGAVI